MDFNELWTEAIDSYIDATNRTPSEQDLLKRLQTPQDLEKELERLHAKFANFRAKHKTLIRRLKYAIQPVSTLSSIALKAQVIPSPFAPAAAIFGAIIFLLKATEDVSDAYNWIDQLFDKLSDFTIRLDEYYNGATALPERLKNKSIQILICLLEVLAHSEKTIKTGRWKRYAAVVFLGKDEKIKASFDRILKLLGDEQSLVIALTFVTNQRMDLRIAEIENITKDTLVVLQRDDKDKRRDKICEWLSSTNFPLQHSDFIAEREAGTGQWFLDSPAFRTWAHGDETTKTLFCQGIPGAGKTVLAAIAIDHLARNEIKDSTGLAYIYCNYKSYGNLRAADLLAAILKQLVRGCKSLPETISTLYQDHEERGTKALLDEISGACSQVCKTFSKVYIVVDALDECSNHDGTRCKLLKKLRDLQQHFNVRLLVTSRPDPQIQAEFETSLQCQIEASDADVKHYVTSRIDQLPLFIRKDVELQTLVEDGLAHAVGGM
jgi:fungal STAND N-terminal Goodbye domain/NACHT domain